MKVSWDDDIPNMTGKIKAMFQTTNQVNSGQEWSIMTGWWLTEPFEKNERRWGWDDIPYMKWKKKKPCLKPPTSRDFRKVIGKWRLSFIGKC